MAHRQSRRDQFSHRSVDRYRSDVRSNVSDVGGTENQFKPIDRYRSENQLWSKRHLSFADRYRPEKQYRPKDRFYETKQEHVNNYGHAVS